MVPFIVLALLVLAAGTLAGTGWVGVGLVAALSLVWLRVNRPAEGPVLWTVAPTHGLTAGDLAGLAGLLVAVTWSVRLARGQ